jgi:hypothetical protein
LLRVVLGVVVLLEFMTSMFLVGFMVVTGEPYDEEEEEGELEQEEEGREAQRMREGMGMEGWMGLREEMERLRLGEKGAEEEELKVALAVRASWRVWNGMGMGTKAVLGEKGSFRKDRRASS